MAAISSEEQANYDVFRECLGEGIVQRLTVHDKRRKKKSSAKKGRRRGEQVATGTITAQDVEVVDEQHGGNNPEELADFIEYIAGELFPSLPPDLRTLTHKLYTSAQSSSLRDKYGDPLPAPTREAITATLPPDTLDSLACYADPQVLVLSAVTAYIAAVTTAPPLPATTKPASNECEICGRDQLPLTYHHLIPREVHAKVLKRGWHEEEELNSVAWICRACHSFVHKIASNEELAREWYSVELLMSREDVQGFARWIGRVRWKAR